MKTILVPATSANLGPGFDSMGVALSKYLSVSIGKPSETWYIEHDLGEEIPNDETNFIIRTARSVQPNLQPHTLLMKSEIPLARGMGSSSAAIVAGIEIANQIGGLALSLDEKIKIACQLEGHPDNALPALLGNCVIGSMESGEIFYTKATFLTEKAIVTIPNRPLETTVSRNVLPETLAHPTAVHGSSMANLLVSSILQQDTALFGNVIERDAFHEPFRNSLVPECALVRSIVKEEGGYGTCLSGAGPTVISFCEESKLNQIKERIEQEVSDVIVQIVAIDTKGLQVNE